MKTSLRRASKRTLALLLGVLMLITSIGFGTIITADAATYYLHYSTNSEPNNYSNHVSMSEGSNGYYYCSFNATQAKTNYYFSINNSSNSGTTTLFGNYNDYSVDGGTGVLYPNKATYGSIQVVQFQVNNTGIVYVGYNPSTKNVKISTNASEVGGTGGGSGGGGTGGGGGTTTGKWYIRGNNNGNGMDWDNAIEMTHYQKEGKDYWYYHYNQNYSLSFKLTPSANSYDNALSGGDIDNKQGDITLESVNDGYTGYNIKLTGTAYIVTDGTKVWATKTNPDQSATEPKPTTPVTHEYTVGVATNYENATVTATVSGKSVSTTTSTFATIDKVKEGSEVTFTAKASDNNKEFKGWFTTLNPNTKQDNGGTSTHKRETGYNAVSMDETFKINLRSNVKIYALYSDSQDEENGGIVSGAIYYYSAPTVNLDIKNKEGNSITKASIGDTITLEAKIPSDGESVYYKNRFKQSTQLQYLYNFYEIENDGSKHLLDSQTGNATKAVEDQRLICTTETTFSETSRYCAEAYCVFVDPEETPFSVGVSDEKTVKSDTEINTDTITVYVDFDNYEFTNPSSAKIVVTDADDIEKAYSLTKLGSDSSSNIYYADDVVVAYTTKDDVNTMKSDFVSINVDEQRVFIDDEDQPELSSLLEHNILWYRANTNELKTNVQQSHYVAGQTTYTHTDDKLKFRASTSRTQSNELSTKRIYLTDNRKADNLGEWEGVNLVYTLDKSYDVAMYNPDTGAPLSGYSEKDVVWFSTEMTSSGKTHVGENNDQPVYYADVPYNVTSYYFENSAPGSTDKAEITYLNEKDDKATDGLTDKQYVIKYADQVNGYYFLKDDNKGKVRMWPKHDWPETPTITQHKSEIYIVKGQSVNIVPQTSDASKGVKYSSDTTAVASVSVSSSSYTTSKTVTVTGKNKGTAIITLTPRGEVLGVDNNGISETIKVTVIDKDKLRSMIAEAEYIIGKRNIGDENFSEYTKNSYAAFETVYSVAIDVYNRSLYNQDEVDKYATLLEEAMNNLCTESKVRPEDNQFDRIGYNTSDVKVISDGNGKVNRPTITQTEIKPYIADVKDDADNKIGYEIIYAEGFGFSCVAQKTNSDFIGWTRDGNTVTEDETLTVEKALPKESVYIAKFEEPVYKLTLNYKFKDFDVQKAGTNEYKDNCLKDEYDSYTLETFISIDDAEIAKDVMKNPTDEAIYGTKVNELAIDCVPDVMSSYYVYSYPSKTGITDKFNLTFNDDNKTAELNIILEQKPREYSIFVNGEPVGSDYHYQEQVVLNAEDHLTGPFSENQKFKWVLVDKNEMAISTVAEEGSENILSLQKEFTVRAFEDKMSYTVSKAEEGDIIDKTSVISPAYTEVIYKDNTRKIQQNFYIQDNLANRDDLKSAGNIFYYWNHNTEQPVDRTVRAFYKNKGITKDTLKDLIDENYSTWDDVAQKAENHKSSGTVEGMNYTYYYKPKDESTSEGLLRYSSANSCWGYIFAVNSADNWEKYQNYSYRVHSFFILDDGTVIVSNTYAQARVNLQPSASGD